MRWVLGVVTSAGRARSCTVAAVLEAVVVVVLWTGGSICEKDRLLRGLRDSDEDDDAADDNAGEVEEEENDEEGGGD